MARLGLGTGRHRMNGLPAIAPVLAGFSRNGAVNPALKEMLARVKNGTGRGKIVMKGDSTTVGQGGGSDADPFRLTGARANRPAAMLAAALNTAGYRTRDGSVVADNGLGAFDTVPLPAYDPRVGLGSPRWTMSHDQGFAGGGLWVNGDGGIASFAPDGPVDTFELVYYNAAPALLEFAMDNGTAAIASGPVNVAIDAGTGFGRVTHRATTLGTHVLQFACNDGAGKVAVASVTAYDGTAPSIALLVDAALGATAADQAATGNGWRNLDHLAYEAPDLTIINLGLNDMAGGISPDAYAGNLRSIIATARASGDVLLVFPYPAAPSFASMETQTAFRDTAAAVAAEARVSFFSLFDHFGAAFTADFGARMADGLVHGDAELYAEIGDLYARILLAMAR